MDSIGETSILIFHVYSCSEHLIAIALSLATRHRGKGNCYCRWVCLSWGEGVASTVNIYPEHTAHQKFCLGTKTNENSCFFGASIVMEEARQ